jgi:hypothetical protein
VKDGFCSELDHRLSIVHRERELEISAHNAWWPFPGQDRCSSLDVHAHRLSDAMSLEKENRLTPVRRLYPWKTHRRHFSAAHISEEGAKVVWEERSNAKQEVAEVVPPVDCGFLYPAPATEKKESKKSRKGSRPDWKRRKTHYKPFNEDEFGERRSPKPVEKRKSLLAELTTEDDILKSLRDFRFPARSVSKERLT